MQILVSIYAPDDPVINSYLLYEKSKVNDLAGIYEISRNWMLHDSQRQSLHIIKSIFGDAKVKVGSSHD